MEKFKATKNNDGTWDVDGMPPWQTTFNQFCELIRLKMAFKFPRYGDGELNCMMGKKGQNCDGHEYFPALGNDLRQAASWCTTECSIVTGIQPLSLSQEKYSEWPSFFPKAKIEFVNADVFHNASIKGILNEFTDLLDNRRCVLVGPYHLHDQRLFIPDKQITLPSKNCFEAVDRIEYEMCREDNIKDTVFMLCASMMSEVLINRFRFSENTFIDFGSVLDPYANVKSRRYHHTLTYEI